MSYFFAGDLAEAQRVGAILGGAWQANIRFARPAGPELPRPGSIRVSLPPSGQGPK